MTYFAFLQISLAAFNESTLLKDETVFWENRIHTKSPFQTILISIATKYIMTCINYDLPYAKVITTPVKNSRQLGYILFVAKILGDRPGKFIKKIFIG